MKRMAQNQDIVHEIYPPAQQSIVDGLQVDLSQRGWIE